MKDVVVGVRRRTICEEYRGCEIIPSENPWNAWIICEDATYFIAGGYLDYLECLCEQGDAEACKELKRIERLYYKYAYGEEYGEGEEEE